MTDSINLMVHGDWESCTVVAGWFERVARHSTDAADSIQNARTTANAGWWGPAEKRFTETAYGPLLQCDDLAATGRQFSTAMITFRDSLKAVVEMMNGAVDHARGGGLTVEEGLKILPPDRAAMVGPAPTLPLNPSTGDIAGYNESVRGHNARIDAFNAKVAVFNECGVLVKEARIKEDAAHELLVSELNTGKAPSLDAWNVGGTTAQHLLDGIELRDEARHKVLKEMNRIGGEAATYTQFANARNLNDPHMTDKIRKLQLSSQTSSATFDRYAGYLRLLEKGLPESFHARRVPAGFGQARRAAIGEVPRHALHVARVVGRGVPVAGDVLTVGDELIKMAAGEQSLRATVVRSVGLVAAGYIGGAVGGGYFAGQGNAEAGLPGAVVGGVIGAVIGDAWTTDQVDKGLDNFFRTFLPNDVDTNYNEPEAEKASHLRYR